MPRKNNDSGKRQVVDNVIFANFRRNLPTTSESISSKEPAYNLVSIRSWFTQIAKRWTDPGRFGRAQKYERSGHVLELNISQGIISSEVMGSQDEPFEVSLRLPFRTEEDLLPARRRGHYVIPEGQSEYYPVELLRILLVDEHESPHGICNCPDGVLFCKHLIAVWLAFGDWLSSNHRDLYRVRGIDYDPYQSAPGKHRLQEEPAQAVEKPLPVAEIEKDDSDGFSENFWENKELPALPQPTTAPAINDSDIELLKKAMRIVSYTAIDELQAVSDIEDLYYYLTHPEVSK